MTKDEARAEFDVLDKKANSIIEDAEFKIGTIKEAAAKKLRPMKEHAEELERIMYDGMTRIEAIQKTGRDPETGKTTQEMLGEMVQDLFGGGGRECNCPACQARRAREEQGLNFDPPAGFDPDA